MDVRFDFARGCSSSLSPPNIVAVESIGRAASTKRTQHDAARRCTTLLVSIVFFCAFYRRFAVRRRRLPAKKQKKNGVGRPFCLSTPAPRAEAGGVATLADAECLDFLFRRFPHHVGVVSFFFVFLFLVFWRLTLLTWRASLETKKKETFPSSRRRRNRRKAKKERERENGRRVRPFRVHCAVETAAAILNAGGGGGTNGRSPR